MTIPFQDNSPSALQDIIVLDLSRVLAGPYASMLLGDFGANVIKVEVPHRGDDTRQWGPPFTESGQSAYFLCANRNKRSITVNLATPEGQHLLRELATCADVLVENFRVGTMAKWGLDYESLHEINPELIFCSISGYGQTGPLAPRPGYDNIIEAQGGIMSITGPAGDSSDEPYKVGVAIVDITAGLYAAMSILAALAHRGQSGEGQSIDIALFDTQLSWLANVATAYFVSGEAPQRYGNGHSSIVPYQVFRASDRPFMLAAANDSQFARLATVCGHPEWIEDNRFRSNTARVANRDLLISLLSELFVTESAATWCDRFQTVGIPCSPVNDIPAALSEPQAHARNMVQSIHHPVTGDIQQLGPVPKMSQTPPRITLPPPLLGEHTTEILGQYLGMSPEHVDELRDRDIV